MLCGITDVAAGQPDVKLSASRPVEEPGKLKWDAAFSDRSGDRPLHFVAHYLDGSGQVHRLEEWRLGQTHLRRKTDDRIDLHADAAGHADQRSARQPLEYVWNILDLQRRTVHRVSSAGMLHLGMLYSYYSMAHVLTRPAGTFTVEAAKPPVIAERYAASPLPSDAQTEKQPCAWWQVRASGQPAMLACWSSVYAIPLRTYVQRQGSWHLEFSVESVDKGAILPGTFQVSTAGFQVRDLDEIQSED